MLDPFVFIGIGMLLGRKTLPVKMRMVKR